MSLPRAFGVSTIVLASGAGATSGANDTLSHALLAAAGVALVGEEVLGRRRRRAEAE